MKVQEVTLLVLMLCSLLLVLYDAVVLWRFGTEATISATLLSVSRQHPLLPFVLGILIGHLLWPQ